MELEIRDLFLKTFSCEIDSMEPISAHGSSRKYFRCYSQKIICLAAFGNDKKENIAFIDYAKQLFERGISVPKVYAENLEKGIYLIEDLGNTTLFDLIVLQQEGKFLTKDLKQIYYKVIEELPKIQINGGKNFDYSNAYPRKAFDKQSIAWDLNYFKYYFLKLSGIEYDEQNLENDFLVLTNFLLLADDKYFLFRDFQSRNIMVESSKISFVDFQGGRKGALQYDLASLLYDAKANLSPEFREELLEKYLMELEKYLEFDKKEFKNLFYGFVYIRIMQAMGAYGFRGYFERKEHFLKSIPYVLDNLKWLEQNIRLNINIPTLKAIFKEMIISSKLREISTQKLKVTIKSFSFKKGYPYDLSGNGGGFVFDCRAINNPGRYPEFKFLTGKDQAVIDFLDKEKDAHTFFENALNMVNNSIYTYTKRNFTHLMVCFGCTGGQHRSVYFAEKLTKVLSQNVDIEIVLEHLEQNK